MTVDAEAARRSKNPAAEAPGAARVRTRRQVTWRGVLGRLLAVVLGIVVPLLLLEASLRLFGPWLPGNYATGVYLVRDQTLGHFHEPDFSGWIKTREYTTHVKTNPMGLRDPRQTYEKPPGTFRIVFLGDSFVEAVQVEQWEGVAAQLEARLNEGSSRPVEVINAGVAAYGTGQEMLLLEHEAYKYQPDLVVLLFYVGNDVTNNNYRLELWDNNLKLALKPYWDVDKEGNLKMHPGPPPNPPGGITQTMRGCCMLHNVIETGVFSKHYPPEELGGVGGLRTPLRGLYDTEPDDEWERAWRNSEGLLKRIKELSAEHGAPFVIAGAPEWRALVPDEWAKEVASARLDSGRLQITSPTDMTGEIAAGLGVPYINLLPPLQAATAAGGGPFYYDFDKHWNAAGHDVAARAIAEALLQAGLAGR